MSQAIIRYKVEFRGFQSMETENVNYLYVSMMYFYKLYDRNLIIDDSMINI